MVYLGVWIRVKGYMVFGVVLGLFSYVMLRFWVIKVVKKGSGRFWMGMFFCFGENGIIRRILEWGFFCLNLRKGFMFYLYLYGLL